MGGQENRYATEVLTNAVLVDMESGAKAGRAHDHCAHDAKIIRRPMKLFVASTGRVNVKKKSHGGRGVRVQSARQVVPECEVHYAQGGRMGCASLVRTISSPIWL